MKKNKLYQLNNLGFRECYRIYARAIEEQIEKVNWNYFNDGVMYPIGKKDYDYTTAYNGNEVIELKLYLKVLPCETNATKNHYTVINYDILKVYEKIQYKDLEYCILQDGTYYETSQDPDNPVYFEFLWEGKQHVNYCYKTDEFYNPEEFEEIQQLYRYRDFEFNGFVFYDESNNKHILSYHNDVNELGYWLYDEGDDYFKFYKFIEEE